MKRRLNGGKPHPNSTDKTGMVFGRLKVIGRIMPGKNHTYDWLCKCSCGNEVQIQSRKLNHKFLHYQSCGCLKREVLSSPKTHGDTGSREYRSWAHIVGRCHNPNDAAYPDYGGRGITVCEKWRLSYESFLKDMGRCPNGMSIDRINNNGNYEPGNCRWTDWVTQSRNKRSNCLFTVDGVTACMKELADKYCIGHRTVWYRLRKAGWSVEEAFKTPVTQ